MATSGGQKCSEKAQLLERCRPAPRDDHVIIELNTEFRSGIPDFERHIDVHAGWRRVPRGMIVHHDQGGRTEVESSLDHLAGIDGRVIHRTLLLDLVGDQHVLAIEVENTKPFRLLAGKTDTAVVDEIAPRRDDRSLCYFFSQQATADFANGFEMSNCPVADPPVRA